MGSRLEQNSDLVRKRIEAHAFHGEDGEEYDGSKFGGFPDYFRRKKIKLQNLDAEIRARSGERPQIFKGVVCHVNGYTQPSLNDLHTMIVQHGGGFMQYLDGKTTVTHIIASNLTPKKTEEFRRYRIVKPAWVVDSIAAGRLIPWNEYRVVDEGIGQKVLTFGDGNIVSQANQKTKGYREQTESSWYTNQLSRSAPAPAPKKQTSPSQNSRATDDDTGFDEHALSEVTSSLEDALIQAEQLRLGQNLGRAMDASDKSQFDHKTKTPPSASLLAASTEPKEPLIATGMVSGSSKAQLSGLRSREGSQEPDFSHAVVRNSDMLKSISPSKLAKMSAEEHNALLLSDPNIRKSTVVNPGFLEQYYRESRLHHLSAWKADLKSQMQALAAEKSSSQKARQKRVAGQRRYIMHVDFDSFFAAVSLKKYPQYKDKAAVVAHGGGSGSEIASCNYPARNFGISNGMWMKRAQQLCPDLKILPYDFPAYEEASRHFYDAMLATDGIVQSVSIDEALIDISALCIAGSGSDGIRRDEGAVHREQAKADELAQQLRDKVSQKTGCSVSVGIGGNILQAKVALRKAKPAGQYQLKSEDVLDFIGELEVTRLPGVAYSIGGKLEEINIKLVKDIRQVTKEKLVSSLGPKTGERMWEYARGIDRTEVGDQVVRKSVSAEVNWGVRFENQDQVDEFMDGLCGELSKRLLKERVKGKQLTMKIMKRAANAPLDPPKHLGHGKCDVFNKSIQLGVATHDRAAITKEATSMVKTFAISPGELRGIGIQMQKLEPLKTGANRADQASQPMLQFKAGGQFSRAPIEMFASNASVPASDDPIHDDAHTPPTTRIPETNQPSAAFRAMQLRTPSKKPLNILGTQFILPTQVDPSVLAELPEDIRAKLAKHTTEDTGGYQLADVTKQLGQPPKGPSHAIAIPPESQIDPSILEELPEDVRDEVLGLYKSPAHRTEKRGDQALLPQSPRKLRSIPPTRQPLKRGRGRPRGSRNLAGGVSRVAAPGAEISTLTQANFVAGPLRRIDPAPIDTEAEGDEPDPEVLAALPEDVRQEVLAERRQRHLQRTGGIDLSLHQRSRAPLKTNVEDEWPLDRHFALPPRPATPVFTSKKLSKLEDLRQAVSAWFKEFSEEGPYDEDISALIQYLSDVVVEEKDLEKATAVVRWTAWIIEDGEEDTPTNALTAWKEALSKMQDGVQDAATRRGLGKLRYW